MSGVNSEEVAFQLSTNQRSASRFQDSGSTERVSAFKGVSGLGV